MDTSAATVAKDAENLQNANEPDSFPPEGTDETSLDPDATHRLEQDQRLKATRAVIKAGY